MTAPQAVFREPQTAAPEPPATDRQTRRVYLIAAPSIRNSPAWPRIRAELDNRVRGAELASFGDFFGEHDDYQERWPQVVLEVAGAVVVPSEEGGRQIIGRVARREAASISEAGKPVLVNVRVGLIPWEQVQTRKAAGQGWSALELIIPGVTG